MKQVGKTRYEGRKYERRYRCLDCGATCRVVGELSPSTYEWKAPPPLDQSN